MKKTQRAAGQLALIVRILGAALIVCAGLGCSSHQRDWTVDEVLAQTEVLEGQTLRVRGFSSRWITAAAFGGSIHGALALNGSESWTGLPPRALAIPEIVGLGHEHHIDWTPCDVSAEAYALVGRVRIEPHGVSLVDLDLEASRALVRRGQRLARLAELEQEPLVLGPHRCVCRAWQPFRTCFDPLLCQPIP